MEITFYLNGKKITGEFHPGRTVLEVLRESGIYSVKYGCDHGECGACTVLVDGIPENACLLLIHSVRGKSIETLEGLNHLKPVKIIQEKFLTEGAVQCGYCTPGMILSLTALFRTNSEPTEEAVRDAIAGNYCRCTGYVKPVKAVLK